MTEIVFTYQIVNVSENGQSMDVLYQAEGFNDMLMGMLLPPEGVDLDAYIQANAPIQNWAETLVQRQRPQVGHSGIGSVVVDPEPPAPAPTATIPVERVVL